MSDPHEEYVAAMLGGRMSKGSGNQWHNPMDGRHSTRSQYYSFAWDGKSTLSKSVSVSLAMWDKAKEQARPAKPLLPLRFYATTNGEVALDLVVLSLSDFALVLEDANRYQAAKEAGCLTGSHTFVDGFECTVCGADVFDAS